MKIYISASIINGPLNSVIATSLEKAGHTVFLPQLFCPDELSHENYPVSIYNMCIDAMNECDLGIITLDCYGRDSSWECGWFKGREKILLGFATGSLRFLQDWMIKGGINGIITDNIEIEDAVKTDYILTSKPVVYIDDINLLSEAILHCLGKK